MKIVVWNVGRPNKRKTVRINQKLTDVNADVIILTETNSMISPGKYFHGATHPLHKVTDAILYKPGEIRVSVYHKYPMVNWYQVFNSQTAICLDIQTPKGLLLIYATIIGIQGGSSSTFKSELQQHLADFEKLFNDRPVCFVGDLNTTFAGRVYPSHIAKQTLLQTFEKYGMVNLTENIENCVDHIVISKDFIRNNQFTITTWNEDKTLSDHIGVMAEIEPLE